ncbi:MAG TPA: CPBP family intramembrane metalloprotease [Gemmatales bacterium]|nr:CPBP family intramembrane metalloprotease [Gemmatales bacterium]
MRRFTCRSEGWIIILVMLAPTAMTYLYFFLLAGQGSLTRIVYLLSKVATGLIPILWYCKLYFESLRATSADLVLDQKPRHLLSFKIGLDFGLFTVAAILLFYYLWVLDMPLLQTVSVQVKAKLADAGATSLTRFLLLAGFLSILHSAFEEYYWRWFVYGRLATGLPWLWAAIISSVGFMLHHVLVLYHFLPGLDGIWLIVICSLGIGFGGFIWCAIYRYTGSLLGAWVAHLCADLVIMWLGWNIVTRS